MDDNFDAIPTELFNPREDPIFKLLLTRPDSKPILYDLLASILRVKVTNVEVRNSELPLGNIGEKNERFDVNCEVDGNKQINVEMQNERMIGDNIENNQQRLRNRIVFYISDLYSSQEGAGVKYENLKNSYQITLCGFPMVAESSNKFLHWNTFCDEDGVKFSDAVNIIIIEMTKLVKIMEKPVSEMSDVEEWSAFFAFAGDPKYKAKLEEICADREAIQMANNMLGTLSRDPDVIAQMRSRKKFQMDMESDRAATFDEGLVEGERKGKIEGETSKAITMAKKMLADGEPVDRIIRYTELTSEQITILQSQKL
ncbi:hypothetical protein FACS1894105_08520 [Clostridia bacterium]|nr:hypothetical protein FACS1894105_08520 [Clostridia bacterium]